MLMRHSKPGNVNQNDNRSQTVVVIRVLCLRKEPPRRQKMFLVWKKVIPQKVNSLHLRFVLFDSQSWLRKPDPRCHVAALYLSQDLCMQQATGGTIESRRAATACTVVAMPGQALTWQTLRRVIGERTVAGASWKAQSICEGTNTD